MTLATTCCRLTAPVLALALTLGAGMTAGAAPEAVDPAACTVAPLTIEQLIDIAVAGTPVAPAAGGEASGTSADEATVAAVTAVARESVACTNANAIMANLALFTDRYLVERFAGERRDDLGHLEAALTRTPAPAVEEDRLALVAVDDVTVGADGRVTATVTTANASEVFVDQLWFTETPGGWKIDAVELGAAEAAGTPIATPSA